MYLNYTGTLPNGDTFHRSLWFDDEQLARFFGDRLKAQRAGIRYDYTVTRCALYATQ